METKEIKKDEFIVITQNYNLQQIETNKTQAQATLDCVKNISLLIKNFK